MFSCIWKTAVYFPKMDGGFAANTSVTFLDQAFVEGRLKESCVWSHSLWSVLHNTAVIPSNFSAIAALSLLFLWQKCSLCWSLFFTSFQRGLHWRNITQEQFLKMDVVQLLNISSVTVYLNVIVSYFFLFSCMPWDIGWIVKQQWRPGRKLNQLSLSLFSW